MRKCKKLLVCLLVMAMCLPFDLNYRMNGTTKAKTLSSGDWEYEKVVGKTVKITHYTGNATKVIIPDVIDGMPVTAIGNGAYTIFGNCRDSLTSVVIPNSITTIGWLVFNGCSSLTDITIPDSVTSIGREAFAGTPWLENRQKENPLVICNDILIDGQTCTGNVKIPNNVSSIAYGAFLGCNGMTAVTIPDSVTSIDQAAFAGCEGITSVTIPDSVTSMSYEVFSGCKNLTSVALPASITEINSWAFCWCSSLTDIVIPDSVTSIESNAFSYCSSLTNITIPKSVIDIGSDAFENTPWLDNKRSENPLVIENSLLLEGTSCTGNITIPEGVTYICRGAFYSSGITGVVIPEGVTSIGASAFSSCKNLTNITIPTSVTDIGMNAFYSTPWLAEQQEKNPLVICSDIVINGEYCTGDIVIPNNVVNIVPGAFDASSDECINISLPKNMQTVGEGTFYSCNRLENITISKNVTSIETYAFGLCSGLTNFTIPDGVINIGNYAFLDCENLTSIIIPDSVTSISDTAFVGCDNLTIIASEGSYAIKYAEAQRIDYMYSNGTTPTPNINSTDETIPPADMTPPSSTTAPPISTETQPPQATESATIDSQTTVSVPKVAKVKSVKVKSGKRKLTLTWKKNSDISGYQIQISENKKFKQYTQITKKNSVKKCIISKLKKKKTYYIRIRAYKTYKNANGIRKKAEGKWAVVKKKTK